MMTRLLLLTCLAGTCLLATDLQPLREDPGWDYSKGQINGGILSYDFDPLKSSVAKKFQLSGETVTDEARAEVVKAWDGLEPREINLLLGRTLFDRCKSPALLPKLDEALFIPAWDRPDVDEGAKELNERQFLGALRLGSKHARELIIEDIKNGAPKLGQKVLLALPDEPVPELQALFEQSFVPVGPNQGRKFDLFMFSTLVGRYGGPQLVPQITAFYAPHDGTFACQIQAGLLRYLVKHAPDAGLERLGRALKVRGSDGKHNNCYSHAIKETLDGLKNPKITAFVTQQLRAGNLLIESSAASYLASIGETSPLMQRFVELPPRQEAPPLPPAGQVGKSEPREVLLHSLATSLYKETHGDLPPEKLERVQREMTDYERKRFAEALKSAAAWAKIE